MKRAKSIIYENGNFIFHIIFSHSLTERVELFNYLRVLKTRKILRLEVQKNINHNKYLKSDSHTFCIHVRSINHVQLNSILIKTLAVYGQHDGIVN